MLQHSLFSTDRMYFSNAPSLKASITALANRPGMREEEEQSEILTEKEDSCSVDLLPYLQNKKINLASPVVNSENIRKKLHQ